ncbi:MULTISPECIES: hypothetical protein [Prauserella salsuginis group]|uniref:Uncharacterized protein n=1 Tax=Prauserella salsuginis TaxID=387889 RepID=A0ABW6G0U1_9PSEU|nr:MULTISPECIES: hypothetical protein [Prauserella salsuginis group]
MIDAVGLYEAWLAKHDRKNLFIRPDFTVAATAADDESLQVAFHSVTGALAR